MSVYVGICFISTSLRREHVASCQWLSRMAQSIKDRQKRWSRTVGALTPRHIRESHLRAIYGVLPTSYMKERLIMSRK